MKFEILNNVEYLKDISENADFFLDAIKDSDTYILRKMKELNVPIPLDTLRKFPSYLSYPEIIDAIKNDLTVNESVELIVNGYWTAPFKKETFSSPLLKDYIYIESLKASSYVFYALEDVDYLPIEALNNLDRLLIEKFNRSPDFKKMVKDSIARLSVSEIEKSLSVNYFLSEDINKLLIAKGADISKRESYWTDIPRAAFLVDENEVDAIIDNYRKFKDTFCFMALNPKLLNADFFKQIIEINPDVSLDELLNGYLNNQGVWNILISENQDTVIFPSVNGRKEFTVKNFWEMSLNPNSIINLNELGVSLKLDLDENLDSLLKLVEDNKNNPVMKGALNFLKNSPLSGVSFEYKPYLNGAEMREFLNSLYDVLPENATSINLDAKFSGKYHFTGTLFKEQIEMMQDAWERDDKELISAWAGLISKYDLTDDNMKLIFSFNNVGLNKNNDSQSFAGFMFVEILKQAPESINKYLFARECLIKTKANLLDLDKNSIDEIVHIFKGFPDELKEPMNDILFNKPLGVENFEKILNFGDKKFNVFKTIIDSINLKMSNIHSIESKFESVFLGKKFGNILDLAPQILDKTEKGFVRKIKNDIKNKNFHSVINEVNKYFQINETFSDLIDVSQHSENKRLFLSNNLTIEELNSLDKFECSQFVDTGNVVNHFLKFLDVVEKSIEKNGENYLSIEIDGYYKLNYANSMKKNKEVNYLNYMISFIEKQDDEVRKKLINEICQNCTEEMSELILEISKTKKITDCIEGIQLMENISQIFGDLIFEKTFKNVKEIAQNYNYKDFNLYNYPRIQEHNSDYLKKFFLAANPSFILNYEINSCILDDDFESPVAPLKNWDELLTFIENDISSGKEKSVLLASYNDLRRDDNLYALFINKIENFTKQIFASGGEVEDLVKMLNSIKNPLAYVSVLSEKLLDLMNDNGKGRLFTPSGFLKSDFYAEGLKDLINLSGDIDFPEDLLVLHKVKKFLPLVASKEQILMNILKERLLKENSINLRNRLMEFSEGEVPSDCTKLISLCKSDPGKSLQNIVNFVHNGVEVFNFIDFVDEQCNFLMDKNKDNKTELFKKIYTFDWIYTAKIKNMEFSDVLDAKKHEILFNKKIKEIVQEKTSDNLDILSKNDDFKL